MKKLTINPKINDGQIDFLESIAHARFPLTLVEVLKTYSKFMEWNTKEEAFEKIADSMEEFIDGLSAEKPLS